MPPSREDQHEQIVNERDAISTLNAWADTRRNANRLIEPYDRPAPLIMRIAAIPFTILGNLLNWWRS